MSLQTDFPAHRTFPHGPLSVPGTNLMRLQVASALAVPGVSPKAGTPKGGGSWSVDHVTLAGLSSRDAAWNLPGAFRLGAENPPVGGAVGAAMAEGIGGGQSSYKPASRPSSGYGEHEPVEVEVVQPRAHGRTAAAPQMQQQQRGRRRGYSFWQWVAGADIVDDAVDE
jgi:hypothetical protein